LNTSHVLKSLVAAWHDVLAEVALIDVLSVAKNSALSTFLSCVPLSQTKHLHAPLGYENVTDI
jgi:hypothetical protein